MSFLEWAIGPGGNLDRRGSRETPHFPLLIFSYFVYCLWTMHFELDMQACQASSPHGGSAMEFTADRDTVDPRGRLSVLQLAPIIVSIVSSRLRIRPVSEICPFRFRLRGC